MDVKTIEEIHADCDPAVCDVRPILTERDALKAELTELHETYETAHASRLHAESVTARLEADNKRLRAECERMERRLAERALSGAKLRELREAAEATLSHWDEFGYEWGFSECIDTTLRAVLAKVAK